MRVVQSKVDYDTLHKLTQGKASKKEFEAQMEISQSLYQKLRQLSIVVLEMARTMVPGKSSSSLQN